MKHMNSSREGSLHDIGSRFRRFREVAIRHAPMSSSLFYYARAQVIGPSSSVMPPPFVSYRCLADPSYRLLMAFYLNHYIDCIDISRILSDYLVICRWSAIRYRRAYAAASSPSKIQRHPRRCRDPIRSIPLAQLDVPAMPIVIFAAICLSSIIHMSVVMER